MNSKQLAKEFNIGTSTISCTTVLYNYDVSFVVWHWKLDFMMY